jgi:hypothetical protein
MSIILGNDLVLGRRTDGRGALKLSADDRSKHFYVCGATGSGKSKFLESLIRQDILQHPFSGCGMIVIDPHGSLFDSIMTWMALERIEAPVIPIDLRRDDWVVSYNLLRTRQSAKGSVIAGNIVEAMSHVYGQTDSNHTLLFARWAGNLMLALYEMGWTMGDAMHLLAANPDLRIAVAQRLKDPVARRDFERLNDLKTKDFDAEVGSTINRLRRFIRNESMRAIFGAPGASLDLGRALDEGSIILVSLARDGAHISREDADLFATLLLTDLWTAAQERGKRNDVRPFYVHLDEFQRFVTPTIAENLDQARGFGLHLTLAHQFPKQLINKGEHGQMVHDSIMENARSKVVFQLSDEENLKPLAQILFRGVMNPDQIKLALESTKVMGYTEEERVSYSRGRSESQGGGTTRSHAEGVGSAHSATRDGGISLSITSRSDSDNEYSVTAEGENESWSRTDSFSETRTPTLIPIMGKEVSSVQFRSLDEQLFNYMRKLFAQRQRNGVARVVDSDEPVAIVAPNIPDIHVTDEDVNEYVHGLLEKIEFAMPAAEAQRRLAKRDETLVEKFLQQVRLEEAEHEPVAFRRRLPSGDGGIVDPDLLPGA